MAERDRELDLWEESPEPVVTAPASVSSRGNPGLLHGILTDARKLVHALVVQMPILVTIILLVGTAEALLVLLFTMAVLLTWALRRARREEVRAGRRGGADPG
ncbi:hypothetical protein [Actinoplanes sp. TFC3]|uniref:hypothetical protein n=1 Tax=Actinoplanes sp. TFC3 TaxID=1710355 RepID=UPI000831B641|nr:hypothetical protein [Actinoplanes sp. TFC3]